MAHRLSKNFERRQIHRFSPKGNSPRSYEPGFANKLDKQQLNDEAESSLVRANRIQNLLDHVKPHQGGQSIFKVPRSLRALEPVAFVPQVVSIGPYHRNDFHLKDLENHKLRILKHILHRKNLSLDSLVEAMSQLEQRTRCCYDNTITGLNSQQLVEMMLLDGCFILELLHVSAYGWKKMDYDLDPMGHFNLRGFLPFIERDLLMLENQLPFFVLQKLFTLAWSTADDTVTTLTLKFFDSVIPGISKNTPESPRSGPPRWLHLLDIVHMSLDPTQPAVKQQESETTHHEILCPISCPVILPCFSNPAIQRTCSRENAQGASTRESFRRSNFPEIVMHSVTYLRGTGVKFRERKDSTKFTDIEFKNGTLLIPSLLVHGSTKSIFLNLMAFEQCYPSCNGYVTAYISFMDGLINTPKDVDHLYKKRIIVHELGSEEDVATLFNNLRKETLFDTSDFYLYDVANELNQHYQQKWHTWKATLRHQYLKNPWKIISLMAAGFLIFLTATQTIYTMVGYHLPNNRN